MSLRWEDGSVRRRYGGSQGRGRELTFLQEKGKEERKSQGEGQTGRSEEWDAMIRT